MIWGLVIDDLVIGLTERLHFIAEIPLFF